MSFGTGYQPMEYVSKRLEEGTYEGTIVGAKYDVKGGYDVLIVDVKVPNGDGKYPNSITFFDSSSKSQEDADKFNAQMTGFFDAFGIQRGNFQIASWMGKKGKVDVKYPKNDPTHNYPPKMYVHYEKKEKKQENAPASAPLYPDTYQRPAQQEAFREDLF